MKLENIDTSKSKEEVLLSILSELERSDLSKKTCKAIAITKVLINEKESLNKPENTY